MVNGLQKGFLAQFFEVTSLLINKIIMTEKITVDGKEVWIVLEAIDAQQGNPNIIPAEYFVAYYSLHEPLIEASSHEPGKMPGKLFTDGNEAPKRFLSPVEAIEYAVEYLPRIW
jgi:hypothetical protein